MGVAGPIAGFVTLIPFLFYGVAHSQPAQLPASGPARDQSLPGHSLAIDLVGLALPRTSRAGMVLNLHPFALAAWLGLLATAINLLPLGQLDGGHILYAVIPAAGSAARPRSGSSRRRPDSSGRAGGSGV